MKWIAFVFIVCHGYGCLSQEYACSSELPSDSNTLVYNNLCYHIVDKDRIRTNANGDCKSRNGSLAVIRNNADMLHLGKWVKRLHESGDLTTSTFWTGLMKERNTLTADNGQRVELRLNTLQNTDSYPEGNCVMLSIGTGEPKMISTNCDRSFWMYGAICQYSLSPLPGAISKSTHSMDSSYLHLFYIVNIVLTLMKWNSV